MIMILSMNYALEY